MSKFSFEKGQKIAKVFRRGKVIDEFLGYLRITEEDSESENEEDEELMELIRNATLTKKEKRRLAEIINERAKERKEPIPKNLDKYLQKGKTEVELPQTHYLEQMPIKVPGSERSTFYIPARSNSGKTTWIANYLEDYLEQFPNNEVYLFSGVPKEEPAFEKFGKKVTVMDLQYFRDNPITKAEELSDFANSMCIFDDINSIPDLRTKKSVITLRDVILQCGRHENVSCMVTAHQALDRGLTAYPIKESDYFVVFPQANKQQTRALLTKYADFTKQEVDRVMTIKSRWVEISRNNPSFVLSSNVAYLI